MDESKKIPEHFEFNFKKYASYDLENEPIYNKLKKVSDSFFFQRDMTNIFIAAMALGFHNNTPIPIKKPSNSIPTAVFTKKEKWLMISIYMKVKRPSLDALYEADDILKTAEDYANGGIKYLDLIYQGNSFESPLENLEQEIRRLIE